MIFTSHWPAGHQYESALSKYHKWLDKIQKEYVTFKLLTVSMEPVRENFQNIYVTYEISDLELENIDLKIEVKEKESSIKYNEEYLKKINKNLLLLLQDPDNIDKVLKEYNIHLEREYQNSKKGFNPMFLPISEFIYGLYKDEVEEELNES